MTEALKPMGFKEAEGRVRFPSRAHDSLIIFMATLTPKIIYEDKDALVINKPAGLLTHTIKAHPDNKTLVAWLVKKYPSIKKVGDEPTLRPGIVHRLDKETSGVMIVAKNQKSFEFLKGQFRAHKVRKTYLALVWGQFEMRSGIIEKPIGIKSGTLKRTVKIDESTKMVKAAKTIYRVKKEIGPYSLMEVEPLTGRTHQIRVHLAALHHPVVGDKLYSQRERPKGLRRLFLHALELEITLPNGARKKFTTALPKDLDLAQFGAADLRKKR